MPATNRWQTGEFCFKKTIVLNFPILRTSKNKQLKLRIMKRALLFTIGAFLLFATSCTRQNGPIIMSPFEKLQGEWYYNKAFFVYNSGVIRDDVLSDFVDCRIIFSGNIITMENLRSGQILEGTFDLYKDDTGGYYDEFGNYVADMERFLTAYLYDTKTNERFTYDWQINYLTRSKLNFGEFYADGNYSFKMKKVY